MEETTEPIEGAQSADELFDQQNEQPETTEPETEEESAPETVKIGDQEFSLEEAMELVKAGRDAKNFVASATQKAQEAARLREEAENLNTQLSDVREFYEFLNELAPDQKEDLKRYVARLGLQEGKAAPYEARMPEQSAPEAPDIDLDQLAPGERMVYDAMSAHTKRLESFILRQGQALASLKDVAEYARAKIGDETAMAKAEAASRSLKQQGFAAEPKDVLDAMRSTKIDDAEAAWAKANLKAIAGGQKPPQPQDRQRPVSAPSGGSSKRSPEGTADDVFEALMRGEQIRNAVE